MLIKAGILFKDCGGYLSMEPWKYSKDPKASSHRNAEKNIRHMRDLQLEANIVIPCQLRHKSRTENELNYLTFPVTFISSSSLQAKTIPRSTGS